MSEEIRTAEEALDRGFVGQLLSRSPRLELPGQLHPLDLGPLEPENAEADRAT